MAKEIGLWIDHRHAVIVSNLDQEEDIKRIKSGMENLGSESRGDSGDDARDRHASNQLNHYYDEIIEYVRHATSILIFGPGEAKGELQKRLEGQSIGEGIVTVKTTDNLTDNQIVAEVRQHFK